MTTDGSERSHISGFEDRRKGCGSGDKECRQSLEVEKNKGTDFLLQLPGRNAYLMTY